MYSLSCVCMHLWFLTWWSPRRCQWPRRRTRAVLPFRWFTLRCENLEASRSLDAFLSCYLLAATWKIEHHIMLVTLLGGFIRCTKAWPLVMGQNKFKRASVLPRCLRLKRGGIKIWLTPWMLDATHTSHIQFNSSMLICAFLCAGVCMCSISKCIWCHICCTCSETFQAFEACHLETTW